MIFSKLQTYYLPYQDTVGQGLDKRTSFSNNCITLDKARIVEYYWSSKVFDTSK